MPRAARHRAQLAAHLLDAHPDLAYVALALRLRRAAAVREEVGLGRVGIVELLVALGDLGFLLLELVVVELARHVVGQLVRVLLLLLVEGQAVVAAQRAPEHLRAVEVVHGENSAALVLVADEGEALGLARVLVARQVHVHDLAELREDHDDVALAQVVRQAAHVHVRRVLVLVVPRLGDVPFARVAHRVGQQWVSCCRPGANCRRQSL
jgi:hypothetical protein